jgi:general secretion pathway protein J
VRDPVGGTYQPALVAAGGSSSGLGGGLSSSTAPSGFSTVNGSSGQPLVALTRSGWTNPTGLQRPALQRVAYYFQDGTLRREYWTVLDPTQASVTVKRDLMTHLKSVSVRFMDIQAGQVQVQGQSSTGAQSGNWSPVWPPVNHANQDNRRYRPIAVEITLETEDWGKIVRIVEMAG